MTKPQAETLFREHQLPGIKEQEARQGRSVDGPVRREAWNNFTDMLCKGGLITGAQYHNWVQPRWLESSRI